MIKVILTILSICFLSLSGAFVYAAVELSKQMDEAVRRDLEKLKKLCPTDQGWVVECKPKKETKDLSQLKAHDFTCTCYDPHPKENNE